MSYSDWSRNLVERIFPGMNYNSHIPADAAGSASVDGVLYVCVTSEDARLRKGTKGRALRVLAVCPQCGKWFAASRLKQHRVVHECKYPQCSDCGKWGELTGHQDCAFPRDHE